MGAPDNPRATDTARFSWLLAALVALLATPPMLSAANEGASGFRIVSSIVLLAALFAVSRTRGVRVIGVALVVPALIANWFLYDSTSAGIAVLYYAFSCGVLCVVTGAISAALVRHEKVTVDTILGGICVYLLLGVIWNLFYSVLEIVAPGSIQQGGVALSALASPDDPFRFPQMLYFSFVTMTTLGYGDIAPHSEAARALAAGQAVVGQLYVAVFIAGLVGTHLAQRAPGDEKA